MLVDSSSIITIRLIGLDLLLKNSGIVLQIQREIDSTEIFEIYEVSEAELNTLIKLMETVSKQINKQIFLETTKTEQYSKFFCLNPSGSKGRIFIHHGELYLMAKCVSLSEDLLCEDEDAFYTFELLSGICGIKVKPISTLEFLYDKFISGELTAIEFLQGIKSLEESKRLYFRFPAKSRRDRYSIDTLYKFIQHLIEKKMI
ncbi:MAG: hypothetical protein ACE5KT_08480 [Methanosarcinales archaeon]